MLVDNICMIKMCVIVRYEVVTFTNCEMLSRNY